MTHYLKFLILFTVLLGFAGCSSNANFEFTTLDEALTGVDPESEGTLIDIDGDGIADAIDTDGDGEGDIDFDPPIDIGDGGDDDTTPDPEDDTIPLRDPTSKDCNSAFANALVLTGPSGGKPSNRTPTSNAKVVLLYQQSNSNTFNVDFSGMSNLERIIIKNAGGSNQINLINADMGVGLCNDMSGGSNEINIDDSTGPLVDLESGTGNNNNLDVFFKPDDKLFYSLSGNGNCIAYTLGTTTEGEQGTNDNSVLVIENDGPCS